MLKKLIYLAVLTVIAFFVHPAAGSYDFRKGLDGGYAMEWLHMYVLPNYDTSKIEQVNSAQSYSVRYEIGGTLAMAPGDTKVVGSEYGGEFHIINENDIFHMLLVNDGRITGAYTNNDEVTVDSINIQGMDREGIHEVYGEPVGTVDKGEKRLIVENDEYDVFEIDDIYVFFFYDLHKADEVNGLLIVEQSEMENGELYNHPPAADNEEMKFQLVNATRIQYGAGALDHHDGAADAAGRHSEDMADNDYFSHDSPDGGTLKNRMEEQGVRFKLAGENIAMGHTSPIFSHHSLLNSEEHRVNTLNDAYTHFGIGVDYNSEDVPYYTENYIKK